MLDSFEILTTSGVVLWSRSYARVSPSLINSLIKDVFIEEKALPGAAAAGDSSASRNPPYKRDQYTLKWTTAKDLGLIFVVGLTLTCSATLKQFTNDTISRLSISLCCSSLGSINYSIILRYSLLIYTATSSRNPIVV